MQASWKEQGEEKPYDKKDRAETKARRPKNRGETNKERIGNRKQGWNKTTRLKWTEGVETTGTRPKQKEKKWNNNENWHAKETADTRRTNFKRKGRIDYIINTLRVEKKGKHWSKQIHPFLSPAPDVEYMNNCDSLNQLSGFHPVGASQAHMKLVLRPCLSRAHDSLTYAHKTASILSHPWGAVWG